MKKLINEVEIRVQNFFEGDATGHDWFHTDRVRKNAVHIAREEGADEFVCEMAALLHDVADDKFHQSEEEGFKLVEEWLLEWGVESSQREMIIQSIETVSYKGGNNKPPERLEGEVVQDADRIDAIGAIGVARTFMFAGAYGDSMYVPDLEVRDNMTKEEYRNKRSSAIHHFYEKLLKLKGGMKTKTGQKIAEKRHQYLEDFLTQFLEEWEGRR
ncbi:HD domain-containing protein [Bacillus shivajii]|uniref:HD domain-containing protein n=1 Tax=Bacillus shivajii TaxID=1983719 RepID=UPI001CFC310D|nr:HD domain-containing protein [Bacillus shivajii]UCZ51556.1 HD domain-containing protein [Bacillus shivajii]